MNDERVILGSNEHSSALNIDHFMVSVRSCCPFALPVTDWFKRFSATVSFSHQKYYGKKSSIGRDVCRLRKAYYSARNEAAVQIDEIVGETASEADSSDSLDRDHGHHHHTGGPGSHDKDDDVIRCICGMYKDEGLMIQCEKCMVSKKISETVFTSTSLLLSHLLMV